MFFLATFFDQKEFYEAHIQNHDVWHAAHCWLEWVRQPDRRL